MVGPTCEVKYRHYLPPASVTSWWFYSPSTNLKCFCHVWGSHFQAYNQFMHFGTMNNVHLFHGNHGISRHWNRTISDIQFHRPPTPQHQKNRQPKSWWYVLLKFSFDVIQVTILLTSTKPSRSYLPDCGFSPGQIRFRGRMNQYDFYKKSYLKNKPSLCSRDKNVVSSESKSS